MFDGMINVKKEKGFTSHDVVAKLRGILHQKKIGHTGTLDPDATGVLPVCLGSGTKLCDMITDHDKTYEAVMILGKTTDTQDISGNVLTECEVNVNEDEVRDAILSFIGDYMQIPPMYSAIKIGGKKLYELARAGQEVERKARPVIIHDIQIINIELPYITLEVSCSKGTYIRTLCHDIGQKLGCGACMTELIRTKVGEFTIDQAYTLSEIEAFYKVGVEEVNKYIISPDRILEEFKKFKTFDAEGDKMLYNGNWLDLKHLMPMNAGEEITPSMGECFRIYDSNDHFIAVYQFAGKNGRLKNIKMFL